MGNADTFGNAGLIIMGCLAGTLNRDWWFFLLISFMLLCLASALRIMEVKCDFQGEKA